MREAQHWKKWLAEGAYARAAGKKKLLKEQLIARDPGRQLGRVGQQLVR